MIAILPITAQAAAPQGGGALSIGSLAVMFLIFYLLVIRPQLKRQRQHDAMVKALGPKDKVVMNSGLYGTVVKVTDTDIILEVSDKVHLRYQRGSVATVRNRDADEDKS